MPAFSFKSAFILAGAVLLGTVVIPYAASLAGAPVNITVMVALPLLIAAVLAGTRYVVDTGRGLCRGALITFAVAWAASLLVCWLVLYQGVMPF